MIHKFHSRQKPSGFSLIEIMVVIALMAVLVNISFGYELSSYQRTQSAADRELLLAALRRARAEAQAGVCSRMCATPPPQGLYITSKDITFFEGQSYATRASSTDDAIPFAAREVLALPVEVLFEPISGDLISTNGTSSRIALKDQDGRTEAITITNVGEIEETRSP